MPSLPCYTRCASCEYPEASKNCIKDIGFGRTQVLFTINRCNCDLPAPICPTCYSRFGKTNHIFNCRWCNKDSLGNQYKKKPCEDIVPLSIGAVYFQYRISSSSSIDLSRLFRSFGMISSDFSNWRNLAKFFIQLDQQFVIHIFRAFMWMNTKKVCKISNKIFQLDDKRCKHSAYMNRIVGMIKGFNLMMTLSRSMFRMSHLFHIEHPVIFQHHDAILSPMISKRILSKLANSESGFMKSLS